MPLSAIFYLEDQIPYPNMSLMSSFDQRILYSYTGQIFLRTHLNSIHRTLYPPGAAKSFAEIGLQNISLLQESVSSAAWIPPTFHFTEDDSPATDILSARMRAKYWGAQVITFRPFIWQVLHSSDTTSSDRLRTTNFIFNQAVFGIKALIESTRAFHGLKGGPPVVTNRFGTAHA